MKIFKSILIFLLMFSGGKAFTQELATVGSPYSVFGLGDISYYTSTRTYSMGIQGISLFGNYINNLNPASLTKMNSTLISVNANYGFLKSSNDISDNEVSNGNVLGFNIGIPFDQVRGWVLSLGFNPMTLANYKIKLQGNTGSQSYTQTYAGKGGLSRISTGMSYNLFRKISLGLEYNYSFGEINEQNFINFFNQAYTNTNIKKQYDFNTSFIKGGAIFEIGRLLKNVSLNNLSIGVVYQSGFNMPATQDAIYSSSLGTDTVNIGSGFINIPDAYGFGITNTFGRKYLVSADVLFQDWTKYSEFDVTNPAFQQSIRTGLGFEIQPTPDKFGFWQILTYRFGGFYEIGNFKLRDEAINSYGIRAGVNIPITTFNSLDFGVNYSVRGTKSNGLIKDEFLNFTMAVNFGELWFLRPREEDQ
jgi:hypothetical protein